MSRADDYMLTAEELRLKRQRRRRILVTGLFLLFAIGLTALLARPTRNAIKGWQARRHAQKAFAFIAQENWTGARDEAIAAYQLRPTEPQAVRAIARLLTRTRQPQALEYWDQLAKIAQLTPEDLRDDAGVALSIGDVHRARAAVEKLLAADPQPSAILLNAQLAAQLGNTDVAHADSEKVMTDSRATSREQLQAIMLELALNGNAEQSETIWQRIETISRGKDAASLDALMLLAQRVLSGGTRAVASTEKIQDSTEGIPPTGNEELAAAGSSVGKQRDVATRLRGVQDETQINPGSEHGSQSRGYNKSAGSEPASPAALKELSAALAAHPLARAVQKLVAFDLLERSDPTQRETLIQRAIAQFKDGDANDVGALSRWLNSKREHQWLIDVIPVEHALKSRESFLQYLDALGALGRWSEIKQLLGSERFPLEPFLQQMYLARCSMQLGEKNAAENNWQRAIEAAGNDPAKLMQVGEFAEKNARLTVADSAYGRAIAEAPQLRPAYQGRLRAVRAQRATAKLHEILAQMLAVWPNDVAVQNDEAYTRALLLPTRKQGAGSAEPKAGGTRAVASSDVAASLRDGLGQTGTEKGSQSTGSGQAPSGGYSTEAVDIAAAEEIENLAEKLVEREPESLPHRTLLALARLRGGHRTRALEAYNIEVPEEVITAPALAVRAAVLYANGRIAEARDLMKQISPDQLVAEERALIAPLL